TGGAQESALVNEPTGNIPDVQTIEIKRQDKGAETAKPRKSSARRPKVKKKTASAPKPQEPRRRRAYSTSQYYNSR
ncbi:MAG: hypothetical protein K2Z81_18135, partial [Cyanobacteria bacterium]|nr:hypothetical protein [Cyanobacteriota bacterium]